MTLPSETPPEVPEPPGLPDAVGRLNRVFDLLDAREVDSPEPPDAPHRAVYGGDWKALVKADNRLHLDYCARRDLVATPEYRRGWADCRAACEAMNKGPAAAPPDPSEVSAAEGRLRRVAAGEELRAVYPPHPDLDDVTRVRLDRRTLADAWLALGVTPRGAGE